MFISNISPFLEIYTKRKVLSSIENIMWMMIKKRNISSTFKHLTNMKYDN